ncbi:MAG: hypothetical protein NXI24_12580 [bacterium]|nr:hypothetical protein [bacterium]
MNSDHDVIEPEIVSGDGPTAGKKKDGPEQIDEAPLGPFSKVLWVVVAIVCGVYIFIPEFTDAIPLIGWLDEATAAGIVLLALQKLRVRIPLIQPVLDWFVGRKKKAK